MTRPVLRLVADDLTGALDSAAGLCGAVPVPWRDGAGSGSLAPAHGWCAALGIGMRLPPLGVPRDDLPIMASEAHAIRRLLDNNPREMSREDILALCRAAL